MTFFQRIAERLRTFMTGRNGVDQLAVCALSLSLLTQLIGSFTGSFVLLILSMAFYGYTLFRIFSRKRYARQEENERFVTAFQGIKTKIRQFFLRVKLSKEYKYFRCSQCKTLIRLRRGGGERTVICPKCGNTFQKKT